MGKYMEKRGDIMNNFTYDIGTRIHFGSDALDYIGEEAKNTPTKSF